MSMSIDFCSANLVMFQVCKIDFYPTLKCENWGKNLLYYTLNAYLTFNHASFYSTSTMLVIDCLKNSFSYQNADAGWVVLRETLGGTNDV